MGLESPFDILGLYRGVALPRQSVMDPRAEPELIFLYRRPILDYWCETGEDLVAVVRHVLIHEIGHHFGFSDEDMERIEQRAAKAAPARAARSSGSTSAANQGLRALPRRGAPARMRQRQKRRQEVAPGAHRLGHALLRARLQIIVDGVGADEQRQLDRGPGGEQAPMPERRAFRPRRQIAALRHSGPG